MRVEVLGNAEAERLPIQAEGTTKNASSPKDNARPQLSDSFQGGKSGARSRANVAKRKTSSPNPSSGEALGKNQEKELRKPTLGGIEATLKETAR